MDDASAAGSEPKGHEAPLMGRYSILLRWSDEDEGYVAVVPELPGVSAVGATPRDAASEIQVAIGLCVESHRKEGRPLPAPITLQLHRLRPELARPAGRTMSPDRAPAQVFPPGAFIRDELEARRWSQADLAARLNCTLLLVRELVAGTVPVTPRMAHSLGSVFGTDPQVWLNLESAYRRGAGPGAAPLGAAERYRRLLGDLLRERERRGPGPLPQEVEDAYTDTLDGCWRDMTADEQALLEAEYHQDDQGQGAAPT